MITYLFFVESLNFSSEVKQTIFYWLKGIDIIGCVETFTNSLLSIAGGAINDMYPYKMFHA